MILAASTQQTIGLIILLVLIAGLVAYLILENKVSTSSNVDSFLGAANRKNPPNDDVFEGPRLDRFLSWALVSMSVVALGLPIYWLGEPGRQTGAVRGFDKRSVKRGEESFGAEHNGFNCAQCHGSVGQGGVAAWNITDYDAAGKPILDPASGSGHFLLYCFDLLLAIYEEAYADPELGPALQKDYPTLDELRWDVPRLILAHNLHGIDIDLRASQIAALALWLRCQRAY